MGEDSFSHQLCAPTDDQLVQVVVASTKVVYESDLISGTGVS